MPRNLTLVAAWITTTWMLTATSARAFILMSTGDPEYNTTALAGILVGSGWALEGTWGSFLGTPIGPHHFISARHVGGAIGDNFVLQGAEYPTTAFVDDPGSDLRIWQVSGTFPSYAQVYTKTDEVGRGLVVFGRGTQRCAPVTVASAAGDQLKGWQWGPSDGRMRWGENQVSSIENGDQLFGSGSGQVGDVLTATFDVTGGANEADLSLGDSAGGLFIQDGSTWKLAGINYAVDGPYNLTNSGAGFDAAIFDAGGLYTGTEGNWSFMPERATNQPGAFYATRVSAHVAWIQSVLSQPLNPLPILQSAAAPQGPYNDETAAVVDATAETITISIPPTTRFYRLSSTASLTIQSVNLAGSQLIFRYR